MAESDSDTQKNSHKTLFAGLVMMLGSSAMQQMGKLVNPLTGKTEVDLRGAQSSIDLIEMLQARTRGNLEGAEEKMLKDLLASLQMNYVQTAAQNPASPPQPEKSAAEKPAAADAKDEPAEPTAAPEPAQAEPAAAPATENNRERKFHKSYGE